MKFSSIIICFVIIALVGIGFYSLSPGTSNEDYKASIVTERQEKDAFMKSDEGSPFGERQSSFTGLKYFEIDPKFRITAKLVPIENKKIVVLPTSSGEENQYLQYAMAEFELDGITNKLLLLEVMDMGPARGTLFLAFADASSAKETYGAGRYLDVKKVPAASSIVLDFNKAYNPYCAYVDDYECPFPPKENILEVAIRAGEKNYH